MLKRRGTTQPIENKKIPPRAKTSLVRKNRDAVKTRLNKQQEGEQEGEKERREETGKKFMKVGNYQRQDTSSLQAKI